MQIATITGNLGADAEVKTSKSGSEYVSLRVGVGYYDGQERQTQWWRVSAFGPRLVRYLSGGRKGDKITVCGEFSASIWDSRNGPQVDLDLVASSAEFGGGQQDSGQRDAGQRAGQRVGQRVASGGGWQ